METDKECIRQEEHSTCAAYCGGKAAGKGIANEDAGPGEGEGDGKGG
jgi:hypothetical protein